MNYLLDTCVISEFVKPRTNRKVINFLNKIDEDRLYISSMTLGELHRGINKLPVGKKRADLLLWLGDIEANFTGRILAFDDKTAVEWSRITVDAEKKGRTLSAFDSIIAAIASEHQMTLITRNIKDFDAAGLKIINPWL